MATKYTLAVAITEKGQKSIYCGPSEDEAIKKALKAKEDEVHIICSPAVSRVIDNLAIRKRAAEKKIEAELAAAAEIPDAPIEPETPDAPDAPIEPEDSDDPLAG